MTLPAGQATLWPDLGRGPMQVVAGASAGGPPKRRNALATGLRVLDLFSGINGWGDPWRARGHEVIGIDNDPKLPATIHADLLTFDLAALPWRPDVILASPPCEGFSVMNIGRNWFHDGTPKTDTARHALQLVERALAIIDELQPAYWVMENPRDKLRVLPPMVGLERRTVTYCHYGEQRMKPTDLWGGFPPSLVLEPACHNGDPCHVRAPRGSRTGTQGFGTYHEKGVIPVALSTAVAVAAEADFAAEWLHEQFAEVS